MHGNDEYAKLLNLRQTIDGLTAIVQQLEQERSDLEIALITAVEHGDAIESQLEQANHQLRNEVRERLTVEKQLRDLVTTITQKSSDLELLLQTITEHSDEMDLHWLKRYIEADSAAREDALTGLANRRCLDECMEREWARSRRESEPLAALMCDVDHFKAYNDRYGHPAGDVCLARVGAVLRAVLRREGDLAARYGGEEFTVLLPNTDLDGAARVAERIQEDLARAAIPHLDSPVKPVLTLSIGVAAMIATGTAGGILLAEADRLLYLAKQQGRDRIVM